MRKGRFAVVLFLLALVAVGAFLAWRLARGFSARDQPSAAEALVARRLRHLAVPRGAREAKNPIPATPEVLAAARAHFADHCAICHGNDGSGKTEIGEGLYPKAPDMRQPETQSLSDGELFYIIHNGIRFTGMPAWGEEPAEKDEASWKLVHFIRHLPSIGKEELEEMEKLNPRSRHEIEEELEIEKFLRGKESVSTPPKHKH